MMGQIHMLQISLKDRDTMAGMVSSACQTLQSVKNELRQFESSPKLSQCISQATKAWEETNTLLRSIGYLLEKEEPISGPVVTSSVSNVNGLNAAGISTQGATNE